ncbi:MAG TPA: hypothetical protein DEB24_00110 [Coriobacteriia bacterium]|nr:hypothetical protein [Coriobacteriia bacterium]
MTEENKPRFSHITVGQESAGEALQPDEEVITIGAVVRDVTDDTDTENIGVGSDGDVRRGESIDQKDGDHGGTSQTKADASADESDFGGPMSTPQKVVITVSLVGFVLIAVWLVWFWAFSQ